MANLERVQSAVKEAGLDALLLMDDRNIYYATDFMPQDSAALITPDKAFVVTDSRYIEAAEKECAAGVECVLTTREKPLLATLSEITGKLGVKSLGAEEEYLSYGLYRRVEEKLGISLAPAQGVVTALRHRKTAAELESLIAAQRIAEKALEEVLPLIRPGVSEREIAAEITYRMLRHGGDIRYIERKRHGARFLIYLPKYSKLRDVLTPMEYNLTLSVLSTVFFPVTMLISFVNIFITSVWVFRENRVVARHKRIERSKHRRARLALNKKSK